MTAWVRLRVWLHAAISSGHVVFTTRKGPTISARTAALAPAPPPSSPPPRAGLAIPVWKVISVGSRADLARAGHYVGAADIILLDAKTPKGALPGGMGLSFDWAWLNGWHAPLPWGLAGGLTAANVGAAVALTSAPLIDTSSGVETAPGVKDAALIAAFCAAARAA